MRTGKRQSAGFFIFWSTSSESAIYLFIPRCDREGEKEKEKGREQMERGRREGEREREREKREKESGTYLRDPLLGDKASRLNIFNSTPNEFVDEPNLRLCGHNLSLVLKTVTRTDLHDGYVVRYSLKLFGVRESDK